MATNEERERRVFPGREFPFDLEDYRERARRWRPKKRWLTPEDEALEYHRSLKKANQKLLLRGDSYPIDEAYIQSAIPRRLRLFKSFHADQSRNLRVLAVIHTNHPITITLDYGTVVKGRKYATTPYDVMLEISKRVASDTCVSKVNGVLWDMSRPLESDCTIAFLAFDSDEGRDAFWQSSALILGQAIEMKYGCKLCVGSCPTKEEGFYYDAFYGDLGLNEDHLKGLDFESFSVAGKKQPFERIEVTRDQALDIFSDNKFKVEIIGNFPVDQKVSVYRCGPLVDLCRGPLVQNTSFVKAFACLKVTPAYWRGDKDRESLLRVYGISFPGINELKGYLHMLEEAKKYNYRELGKNQELFFIHPLSPGSCAFLPHGARICNRLMEFRRTEFQKRKYLEVVKAVNTQPFEPSGHADISGKNMDLSISKIQKQEIGITPMNCTWNCQIFEDGVHSYQDLPLRLADFGHVHRTEEFGSLIGWTHSVVLHKDDAHIFCRESQIKAEVRHALKFIYYICKVFGFTYKRKLLTRPENFLGDLETWNKAEAALREALKEPNKSYVEEAGSALYGPKIDIIAFDSLKRKFQFATLQMDFQLPSLFESWYSAEDEAKREQPVMIHRSTIGSVGCMVAILLEHYKGKWPFWLSPRQAIVCSVSENAESYALKVMGQIREAGFYVDADSRDRRIDEKVQAAQMAQYNYVLVVGEEEVKTGQVRVHGRNGEFSVESIELLLKLFKDDSAALK